MLLLLLDAAHIPRAVPLVQAADVIPSPPPPRVRRYCDVKIKGVQVPKSTPQTGSVRHPSLPPWVSCQFHQQQHVQKQSSFHEWNSQRAQN